ncbi:molecular chaperone IbpA [Tistlia consotensis]|uniref:Molecular chaperone IbpA n=1 Tax=Tistlia consotensis USBA 355 TaxID=560819 RepID=A0A1Y6BWX8_9PROT|nr:Hsp20 family protein [Tistlia consotensis]SMF33086.1 molecular chaperone IbpA [Tistlia consotensis USBA 355]SNR69306.1 molecular chaperone IbpA [Tistlia consotensis]
MRSYDLSPLLRATVGFDRLMNVLDTVGRVDEAPSYPPYNIEKTGENAYRISMAVAGFADEDLSVTVRENQLLIEGRKATSEEEVPTAFLHRGIATRAFQRTFQLADHIQVKGAKLENGLLHVELYREIPEAMKPRSVEIERIQRQQPKTIENQAAA